MITLNPKQTFLNGPHSKTWDNVVASEMFQAAVSAAMLQMQVDQRVITDGFQAQRNSFHMEGANYFVSVLMNLTTVTKPPQSVQDSGNLDHSV